MLEVIDSFIFNYGGSLVWRNPEMEFDKNGKVIIGLTRVIIPKREDRGNGIGILTEEMAKAIKPPKVKRWNGGVSIEVEEGS